MACEPAGFLGNLMPLISILYFSLGCRFKKKFNHITRYSDEYDEILEIPLYLTWNLKTYL
ncbi:hypothetical protein DLD82_01820 [Methanospirillum stamsii]|uniref:Uncharacterized protein n=1 Tax=Methanospirillum stamsii TaxID=1277351 RepID=A0A2V2NAR0_9EURY|nr:hypothetical protein DLD82_01820 [Methanospirillum stamsii]